MSIGRARSCAARLRRCVGCARHYGKLEGVRGCGKQAEHGDNGDHLGSPKGRHHHVPPFSPSLPVGFGVSLITRPSASFNSWSHPVFEPSFEARPVTVIWSPGFKPPRSSLLKPFLRRTPGAASSKYHF